MAKSVKGKVLGTSNKNKSPGKGKNTNVGLINARTDVGNLAGDMARGIVIEQCAKVGLTVPKVLSGIVAGMEATEQKIQYSQPDGDFVYSNPVISWSTRQKAIDQAIAILGIKAPEKSDLNVKSNVPAVLMLNFIDEDGTGNGKG